MKASLKAWTGWVILLSLEAVNFICEISGASIPSRCQSPVQGWQVVSPLLGMIGFPYLSIPIWSSLNSWSLYHFYWSKSGVERMINGRKILDTHYGRESEAQALFSSFFFIFVGCCSLSRKDWCQTKLFLSLHERTCRPCISSVLQSVGVCLVLFWFNLTLRAHKMFCKHRIFTGTSYPH